MVLDAAGRINGDAHFGFFAGPQVVIPGRAFPFFRDVSSAAPSVQQCASDPQWTGSPPDDITKKGAHHLTVDPGARGSFAYDLGRGIFEDVERFGSAD
jgi:hypothetical protein